MKYLKRFNESINLRMSYKDSNAYHSLIDSGFDIFYESYRISIGKSPNSESKGFKWENIESDVIPLLEVLSDQFKIFKRVIFMPNEYKYEDNNIRVTIDDVINDELNISDIELISIELPFLSPEDNDVFKDKLTRFLEGLGYEDVEYDRNECRFHNEDSWGLINNDASKICDFIEEFGYEYDDFSIQGSYIEFPSY
jgi:hypothetical protein